MAIVSLGKQDNSKSFQSGKAIIFDAKLQGNKVTLWFEMKNGSVIRESYRLYKEEEVAKLKAAVKAILRNVPEEFDTGNLIGKPCRVQLEERPWLEDRAWTGVAEVTSWEENESSYRKTITDTAGNELDDFFDEDDI